MLLLTTTRDALLAPLQSVAGIVEKRHTLPILSNVLIEKHADQLTMLATDIEIQIRTTTGGHIGGEDASITVGARKLQDILRALPDSAEISLTLDDKRLTVKAGRSRFQLQTLPAADYPRLAPPEGEGVHFSTTQKAFKKQLALVQYAMAQQDIRYYLNGLLLVVAGGTLRMVATDGHRLACAEAVYTGSVQAVHRMLVPRKALAVMRRLLEGDAPAVSLNFGEGALQLQRPGESFWFRLIDGEFPDYRAVVPNDPRHTATLRRADLTSALKRVVIVITDRARPARFAFAEDEVEIRVQNVDKGEVRETLPIELDGAPLVVGFNARYLSEALNALAGDRVVLSLANPLAPCLVRDPDRDDAWFVVMPMRLD